MGNTKKRPSKQKWKKREYHVQNIEYVEQQDVKTYCTTNQFPESQCCVPHNKTHGVCVLSKHYHMSFDPKLGHVRCEMHLILCAFTQCAYTLDITWVPGVPPYLQPCYQTVK